MAATRALALVGVPFRLHGRDPASGLDCIGLAAHALGISRPVPSGYALAGTDAPWRAWFAAYDFLAVGDPAMSRPGDLWLVAAGPRQRHIMVRVAGGFVHADARVRRVVRLTGPSPWPCAFIARPPV